MRLEGEVVSAVGSSSAFIRNYPTPSSGGLEAQLVAYKGKLADWESCPSCRTAEGKAKIAEISDKISEIQSRINAAEQTRQRGTANAPAVSQVGGSTFSEASDRTTGLSSQSEFSPHAVVGSRVDVYV